MAAKARAIYVGRAAKTMNIDGKAKAIYVMSMNVGLGVKGGICGWGSEGHDCR